jgi:RHS repeat-associated protein
MQQPGRKFTAGSGYRYGFNGKENDNEVAGDGNQYDYGFRIYNPRIGKFLSVDPLTNKYPELTPYQFASNMPIIAVDLDGEEAKIVTIYHGTDGEVLWQHTSARVNLSLPSNMSLVIHKYFGYNSDNVWTQIKTTGEYKIEKSGVDFQVGRIDLTVHSVAKLNDHSLGKLSESYESRGVGDVSTGNGDAGGVSYGSWQLASKKHRPSEFLAAEGQKYAAEFGGAKEGSGEFTSTWKKIAKREPEEFKNAQHGYIKRTHYDVVVASIKRGLGLDINNRSSVLQDVIWSTAVQHGPGNKIVQNALAGQDLTKLSDADIISLIYDERGRVGENGNLVYFSNNSAKVQAGVKGRFKSEKKAALKKLGINEKIITNEK